ncbi:MAG TPA: DMT family transporter [Burkholderiales bacterium]|jgi:drug/metabolite transporter (DMT)-like permease|nr:DMT family transporter [Burkholderiales bacterium]
MQQLTQQKPARSLLRLLASPYLGLTLAALLWSGNFVVGRALRGQIEPLALNFWRWAIGLAVLLLFTWAPVWRHRRALPQHWKLVTLLGLTGMAVFHTCVYIALTTTTALNALLLLALAPLFTACGAWVVFRDPVTRGQQLGLAVALAGALLLIARGSAARLLNLHFGTGDLWMIFGVVIWTAYSLLLKKRPPGLPQAVLLTASCAAGVACMLPLYLWMQSGTPLPQLSGGALWGLLYVAVMASPLAFFFWNSGVAKIGPGRASTFIYLMPFFGAVLSFVFLGEGVQGYQLAGGVLVFLGIALMNRRSAGK